ncbi:murein biosynthesis integral membrane protein MurJ [Teredinibacter haidensis]|uniref:murein biosynthesis integral membrane protein MurJ n=1 Tax=Teredinibacter haidensis TaxID=2731755 RepID=UPI00094915E0|nr:murein biosynthesis integral membrane protein MurJ [Teredinibacter haidensis]
MKAKGMLRSSAVVSAMTMLSRILGLVRDVLFARFLGAEASADAFYVAFKIPNFLRRLFAEGAFAQAFVPVLSEYREQGSYAAVRHFIDRIAGCLGSVLVLISVLVVVAAPLFTAFFGMGFLFNNPDKFQLTTELLRITFPYLLLISLTGFAGSILNSYDQFAVPAFTPVLLNVALIFAAAVVSPMLEQPVFALAWGVIVAGVLQLMFQLPFLVRLGLLPHPKVDWGDESVRKVLKLMAPAMFGVSVGQINLLFDTVLASFLPDGSISWLYFSDRLTELPLGVFGVGIATVVLPNLSRQFVTGTEKFSATLDWAMRMILLIGLPAAFALMVLAKPILFALFQYGEYLSIDVEMSSHSLRAYSLGLVAFMLIKVLASGFFSRQDTRTPVRIGIIAMVANMVMNVMFVLPFHFIWQIGHAGLALATSISAFLNASLLYRGLRRDGVYQPDKEWLRFGLQMLVANIAMIAVLLAGQSVIGDLSLLNAFGRISRVLALCFAGLGVYMLSLWGTGIRLRHLRVAQ